jgi:ferrochelatase
MSQFRPEPPYQHSNVPKTGVLLVNLGTPDAPTAPALRRYLKEFLSDPRVVEIPRLLWWMILNLVILNLRPAKSAKKYASIWQDEGSPLRFHTQRQAKLLAENLARRVNSPLVVDYAMRYGNPGIATTLDRLKAQGCNRILFLPLYPQYAASTTATAVDELAKWLRLTRTIPEVRTVNHFHDHPAYIAALASSVREHWAREGRPDKLIMSFHGLPRYTLSRGDPYHCECHKSARLLAESLGLDDGFWKITFQSRFGKTEWLKPYTSAVLEEYAKAGVGRVDVVCPGFTADCLETLEEIAIEGKTDFLKAGGKAFHAIACLNERPDWIEALGTVALEHLGGWVSTTWNDTQAASDAQARQKRALAADSAN